MNRIVLCIGSNMEPKRRNVEDAIRWCSGLCGDIRCSSIYETPEIHGIGAPYANAVLEAFTEYGYEDLNTLLKSYELRMGRDGHARQHGIVPIDVDIVLWNDEIIRPKDFRQSFFRIGFMAIEGQMADIKSLALNGKES